MAIEFLDTNVVIRYVTRDDPERARQADELFRAVRAGARQLTTGEGVLVEIVQVLSSPRLYNRPREEIRGIVSGLLALDGFVMPNSGMYLRALDLYASTNLDFVDVLNVAQMERDGMSTILSFDHGFDRLPITRREP